MRGVGVARKRTKAEKQRLKKAERERARVELRRAGPVREGLYGSEGPRPLPPLEPHRPLP